MPQSAYEPFWVVLLGLAIEATFPERKLRGNRAVVIQGVGLNRVVRVFFEKRRNVGNDVPGPHETIEVNLFNCFHFWTF
jgi:hypothetical protein